MIRLFSRWTPALALAVALGCSQSAEQAAPGPREAEPSASSHDPVEVPDASPLDVAKLKQRLDAGEDVFLLDVRNPDELAEHGLIAGAVNIPIDELPQRLSEVPKDKPIVTYCMRGGRASRAAKLLRENGYDQPIEFGGIIPWKEAGYPVAKP